MNVMMGSTSVGGSVEVCCGPISRLVSVRSVVAVAGVGAVISMNL